MDPILVKVTTQRDVPILDCVRCDTALLPTGEWPKGAPAVARCPLCGWEQPVYVVDIGGEDAVLYNLAEQQQDAEETPVYAASDVAYEEDLALVTVPDLLEDSAFYALQDGVAPVAEFGWVGGEGIFGANGYRLFLVVRVAGQPGDDLFRVEFPVDMLPQLGRLTEDTTVVLVSQRKGVFFPEAGEVYLEAVAKAGGKPGALVPLNTWVQLETDGQEA